MLVALLSGQGTDVIGIASGQRVDAVRAAGAKHAIDRASENIPDVVRTYTNGRGVDAVFDPIGAPTLDTSLQVLAPRGCLVNYGELSGVPQTVNLHQLFAGSIFVTRYNGMRWVEGFHEFPELIRRGLTLAENCPAVVSEVAGRFRLDQVAEAYRLLESGAGGKVLVLPNA